LRIDFRAIVSSPDRAPHAVPLAGEVRELQNVIERAVSPGLALHVPRSDLKSAVTPAPEPTAAAVTLAEAEREHILVALRETGWVVAQGGRGPPGDIAFNLAGENEKTRHLPTPVVPTRSQQYRPGGTSYLALAVLAADWLDPSEPQVPLNAAFTMRSDRFRPCRHGLHFRGWR